jgi:tetratricopeptide (TPR) repeat protein
MKEYAPGVKPAALSLVDVPAPTAGPAKPVAPAVSSADAHPVRASPATGWEDPVRAAVATGPDRFLTQATTEHAAGHIDSTLWARAVAYAGGDNAQAKSVYLRSRATALRVTKRDNKAARYAGVVESLNNAPDTGFELPAPKADAAPAASETDNAPGVVNRNRRRAMVAAAVIGSLIVVAGLVMALSGSDRGRQDKPRFNVFAHSTLPTPTTPATAATGAPGSPGGEDFVGKVRALEKEGNWNVVVLYAVEWTRKQPANAEAWRVLSQGYITLRQHGEAQDAATKAVELAPDDFLQWQNLGQINLAIPAPEEALKAFHRAAMLNDHDLVSLVQTGMLNAQFGRLPEARAAFAQALTVSPQNLHALCGAASVAQREGRATDAQAMTRQVSALGERCNDSGGGASVRVPEVQAARAKTAP